MRLSIRHPEHTNAAGNAVHGCGVDAKGVKHLHEPALSQTMKDWVRTSLLKGNTTEAACQISNATHRQQYS